MKIAKLLYLIPLALMAWGCYPAGPDLVEDTDIVYTTFDEGYDFSAKSTYAMPDKIVIGVDINNVGDTTLTYMKQADANRILDAINANMQNYGWTQVDISADPDVLLTPAGMSNTSYYYTWWYNWWYNDWYSWWGWYYPPYVTIDSYTTGTLVIAMADPNVETAYNQTESTWLSISNGILTKSNDIDRAVEAVETSFIQSPYLNIK